MMPTLDPHTTALSQCRLAGSLDNGDTRRRDVRGHRTLPTQVARSAVATAKVSDAWPDGKDRGVDILAGEGLESVEIAH
jgi:hypothetical protein